MARAAGIPCREVSGLIYMGDSSQSFCGHAWNQVVIDGRWIPVDPTWGEIVINATHIALTVSDRDFANIMAVFLGLNLQIVSVQ